MEPEIVNEYKDQYLYQWHVKIEMLPPKQKRTQLSKSSYGLFYISATTNTLLVNQKI
jgi:hypothetical protein